MKDQELKERESPLGNAIKYLEALDFDTCCDGTECGCMGMPIDPEYYILQDLYEAKSQLAKKDQIIAELKRSNSAAMSFYPRFWSKVSVLTKNQCWEWQSSLSPSGYGQFSLNNYPHSAHVLSYQYFNNDFDKNLVIDHTCMNRKCVNPSHLRQVTYYVNSVENSNSVAAKNSAKTHCKNGHKYTEENTGYKYGKHRYCKICKRVSDKKHRGKLAREVAERVKELETIHQGEE